MTGAFRLGHAGGDDWQSVYDACLGQITPLPANANFGLIYVTDLIAGELPDILDRLRRATGIAAWVGSVGMGICATGVDCQTYVEQVLAGVGPDDGFRPDDGVADRIGIKARVAVIVGAVSGRLGLRRPRQNRPRHPGHQGERDARINAAAR